MQIKKSRYRLIKIIYRQIEKIIHDRFTNRFEEQIGRYRMQIDRYIEIYIEKIQSSNP